MLKRHIKTDREREDYIQSIQKVRLDGKRVYEADWKLYRKRRSLSANALYWLCLACIADETGNDKDTLHEHFKGKYLPKREIEIFGEKHMKPMSTTELDSKQFTDYLEKISADMAQEGIMLPNPEEQHFEAFVSFYEGKV